MSELLSMLNHEYRPYTMGSEDMVALLFNHEFYSYEFRVYKPDYYESNSNKIFEWLY